jgi:hypothetical protein
MIVRRLRLRPGFPCAQPQVTSRMEAAVLVGEGAAGGGNGKTLPLKLLGATPAPNGVVALTYQPASS